MSETAENYKELNLYIHIYKVYRDLIYLIVHWFVPIVIYVEYCKTFKDKSILNIVLKYNFSQTGKHLYFFVIFCLI